KEPVHRFTVAHYTEIAHELGPEARIDEVKNSVLDSADVLVDREPVPHGFGIERAIVEMRVSIAIKIPGGIHKRVHGIGLTPRRAAALWAGGVHKFRQARERRSALQDNLNFFRQEHR